MKEEESEREEYAGGGVLLTPLDGAEQFSRRYDRTREEMEWEGMMGQYKRVGVRVRRSRERKKEKQRESQTREVCWDGKKALKNSIVGKTKNRIWVCVFEGAIKRDKAPHERTKVGTRFTLLTGAAHQRSVSDALTGLVHPTHLHWKWSTFHAAMAKGGLQWNNVYLSQTNQLQALRYTFK